MEQIITLKVDLFLPPCGDGIEWKLKYIAAFKLSPPYGDSTDETFGYQEAWAFSPPCGDGT